MKTFQFYSDNFVTPTHDFKYCPIFAYQGENKFYVYVLSRNGEYVSLATEIDPTNPEHAFGDLEEGFTLEEFARNFGSWFTQPLNIVDLVELDLNIGVFHRRIWRPGYINFEPQKANIDISDMLVSLDHEYLKQSLVSLDILLGKLNDIFKTVEPDPRNAQVYGHELRTVLLLASMEVEVAFKGILRVNGYDRPRPTTVDFVKLKNTLRLSDWYCVLASYPRYGLIAPFSNWDDDRPTQSLGWYHAYNLSKHDRELNFSQSNLKNVISSVCAAVILIYAQFGFRKEFKHTNLEEISIIPPHASGAREYYIPLYPAGLEDWDIENYSFPDSALPRTQT